MAWSPTINASTEPVERMRVGSLDPISRGSGLLMLPGSENLPTLGDESLIHRVIARDVSSELRSPVGGICPGQVAVFGAAVPKAAVDEDGKASSRKDEIRTHQPAASPDGHIYTEAQSPSMNLRPQGQLRSTISSSVAPHPFANGWIARLGVRKWHGS
jgi:hypothetical protein